MYQKVEGHVPEVILLVMTEQELSPFLLTSPICSLMFLLLFFYLFLLLLLLNTERISELVSHKPANSSLLNYAL